MSHYNSLVRALLTDRYQLTMARTHFECGRHELPATFDLFFRRAPFGGAFAVSAGLRQIMEYVQDFCFTYEDLEYLKTQLAFKNADPKFFEWLGQVDCRDVRIYAPPEGTIVFPRVPLLRVGGPLGVIQLLETTLLNQINYATLVATNAARMRLAAGWDKMLWEYGLRRAQGADGAMSASLYSYLGSFDGTSNELAGQIFGLNVGGTMAHSFIQSYLEADLDKPRPILVKGQMLDLTDRAKKHLTRLQDEGIIPDSPTNKAELAAFLDYAWKNPSNFLALIDTYNVLLSGLPNFLAVALALSNAGYQAKGVRIDSGDLAYLSREIRKVFRKLADNVGVCCWGDLTIVASNDINEQTIINLNQQGHEINTYGVGTNLVTCEAQPALGGVYKLVEILGLPRIKLSEDKIKTTTPCCKNAWRLFGENGAILDLMTLVDEPMPTPGQDLLCRDPFDETKRATVCPVNVMPLLAEVWNGLQGSCIADYRAIRSYVIEQLRGGQIREDHLRLLNPTPYKVAVSPALYQKLHELMLSEASVPRLS